MSVEETEAYSKLEEERKSELVEDAVSKKQLLWMMFQVGVKDHANDQPSVVDVVGHKITGLVHKKEGMHGIQHWMSVKILQTPAIKYKW